MEVAIANLLATVARGKGNAVCGGGGVEADRPHQQLCDLLLATPLSPYYFQPKKSKKTPLSLNSVILAFLLTLIRYM